MRLNTQSSGQRPAFTTKATQTAFTLTPGRYAVTRNSSGIDTISDGTNTHQIVPMGIFRGATIGFGGTGADDSTASYRIWLVRFAYARTAQFPNGDPTQVIGCEVDCYIANSVITLSTLTGISGDGDVYLDADRLADTLTMVMATTATTPVGSGTVREAAYQLGTASVFSPGSNAAPAKLFLPHVCGAHGFIIEIDLTGATGIMADVEHTL